MIQTRARLGLSILTAVLCLLALAHLAMTATGPR